MRECQACDPSAAARSVVEPVESVPVTQAVAVPVVEAPTLVAGITPEPVAEGQPVVSARAAELEPEPERRKAQPQPVARPPLVEQPIEAAALLPAAVTEPAVESAIKTAPVTAAPVVEESREAAALPPVAVTEQVVESAIKTAPVVEQPIEAAALLPVAVTQQAVESAIKTALVTAAPVVEQPIEAAAIPPVAVTEQAVESAIKIAPVTAAPVVQSEQTIEAQVLVETAPVANVAPEPVVEPAPVVEAIAEAAPAVAEVPEPVAQPLPVAVKEPAVEAPVSPEEEIDPFLALAEGIRAVHTVRAAALAAPPESAGILELAEAVGVQQQSPVSSPATSAPVVQSVKPAAPEPSGAREAVAKQEAVALLAPPEPAPAGLADEGPTLPFAPMQNYSPATSRSILPRPPRRQILAADSGPRITLPGPTLPPELTRLLDANVVTVIGEQTAQRAKEAIHPPKPGGPPGWLVSAGVMLLLLTAALALVFYLYPRAVADAKPAPMPAEAATANAPTGSSSPLSKFIEVTGFRIVVDSNKKSEVQYLVVNHSAADVSNVNVFITLHGVKPGQPPVCRFSFKVPSLGPFESKEMSSPIEKVPPTFSLPPWQDLRADVQISQ